MTHPEALPDPAEILAPLQGPQRVGTSLGRTQSVLAKAALAAAKTKNTDNAGEPIAEAAPPTPLPPAQPSTSLPGTSLRINPSPFPVSADTSTTPVAQAPPCLSVENRAEIDEVEVDLKAAKVAPEKDKADAEKAAVASNPTKNVARRGVTAAAKLAALNFYQDVECIAEADDYIRRFVAEKKKRREEAAREEAARKATRKKNVRRNVTRKEAASKEAVQVEAACREAARKALKDAARRKAASKAFTRKAAAKVAPGLRKKLEGESHRKRAEETRRKRQRDHKLRDRFL